MNKGDKNIQNIMLKNNNEISSLDSKENKKSNSSFNDTISSAGSDSKTEHSNISSDASNTSTTNNSSTDNNALNVSKNSTKSSENHSLDVIVLNEISEVCQLAMCNISYLANIICDNEMKKTLVAIYSQYSNIILQINQRFEKYGEIPSCVSIKLKMMGLLGVKTNTLKDKSSSHVADMMLQGTLMGIIKCQKILNSEIEISKDTKDLLINFNDFQRENMQKLNAYL